MQFVRFGKDHEDSSSKSCRGPSRNEVRGEGVHRRDGTLQCRVTVRVPVLHCVFADQYTKFVFVDLLKAKSEALVSLK